MALQFTKATKKKAKLRLAFLGPAGGGKTYSSLEVATHLAAYLKAQDGKTRRIGVVDTEHGTASKYAGLFEFEALELDSFSPDTYVEAIDTAAENGIDILVIDSLSHAWTGKAGALEQVDKKAKGGNNFTAWRDVTPMHNRMVEALIAAPMHLIATMRVKMEYIVEENEKGKKVPRKIGLAPVQRDGLEYEFDVVGDLDLDNVFTISKTRCPALRGEVINKPGKKLAKTLVDWLTDGAEAAAPSAPDATTVDRLKDAFTAIGINDAKLEAYLGHDLSKITSSELLEVRGVYKAIKEGRSTWADAFSAKHPAPAAGPSTEESAAAAARAKAAEAEAARAESEAATARAEAERVKAAEAARDAAPAGRKSDAPHPADQVNGAAKPAAPAPDVSSVPF